MPPARVTINLSHEGLAKLKVDAEAKGLSVSAYICKKCGIKPLPVGRPWPKKEKRTSEMAVAGRGVAATIVNRARKEGLITQGTACETCGSNKRVEGYDPSKPYGPGNGQE